MSAIFVFFLLLGLTGGQIVFPDTSDSPTTAAVTLSPVGEYGPPPETGESQCQDGDEQKSCRPLVQCFSHINDDTFCQSDQCVLPDGSDGYRCPDVTHSSEADVVTRTTQPEPVALRISVDESDLDVAGERGQGEVGKQTNLENEILTQNQVVQRGTPAFGHLLFFKSTSRAAELGERGLEVIEATRGLTDQFDLNSVEGGFGLTQFSVTQSNILQKNCPPTPTCVTSKYRTQDGSCNNVDNPKFGQIFTPFQRLLRPKYDDGIYSPRVRSVDGETPLPHPRDISTAMAPDRDNPAQKYTLLVMQMGQFIDHDLTHSPIFRLKDEASSGIECCTPDGGFVDESLRHPQCFPLTINDTEGVFKDVGRTCMNFVRSLPAPRLDCSFGYAEQMNQLTHWLDGSNVYGSTEAEMAKLREYNDGRLRVFRDVDRDLLPLDLEDNDCTDGISGLYCFKAGDFRVNEQIQLTVMHTVWMREHNRVAGMLAELNPGWEDEDIFQETRRIVIAEMQHIIYNEWLPVVLGRRFMKAFNLLPLTKGVTNNYSPDINPQMTNEFATAGFRLGHTLVQGIIHLYSTTRKSYRKELLRHYFDNPHELRRPGILDDLIRGLATQSMQTFDNLVSKELTEHLFEPSGWKGFGMDLVSLNIQRGRDHGLPGYNEYRDICGMKLAQSFRDLRDVMSRQAVSVLENLYNHVDDIDLYIAGILEHPIAGSILGQTFICIVGDQFLRVKRGDRFYYELGNQSHSFAEAQLSELRKTSIARILCDNGDNITSMQPLAFRAPSRTFNKITSCDSPNIPAVNLAPWRGEIAG